MVRDLADFPRPVLAALAAAERLLTRRSGSSVVLADPEDLGGSDRSVVARARVARNPFSMPRTVVVKHYIAEPDRDRPDPFHYEVASCQLFTALPADIRPSPEIIAYDPQTRLLVLEDLGRSSTLADKLFGSDAAGAQRCLLSWARGLGRMQAATAGRENDFGALLRRLGERAWRDPVADDARAAIAGLPDLLTSALGVTPSAAAIGQAHATARLLGGTRYRAFSPSDTCPDNNLVTSRGVRFVDFEGGCFRDVALDAAYFRVPFPGCEASFALPDGMGEAMLEAWRDEIVAVWPDLDDPVRLERRLLEAQLLWVWLCTWWLLPRIRIRDCYVGPDAGRSPRISIALTDYWSRLAEAADGVDGLTATADLAVAVTAALRERFAAAALPLFPAFRGAG
ncbi:hypothetical protein [Pseudonocardia asaccharolytica]|uniref:Aminoglycoside phosphotransferase domain-containing protein n=1 Tax=Pseudonocardia asaccharolytica DSM 44247 = NBRC 16224 TaxID=1123024 RepID=A0A511D621_9PSEU|nr:hypothetical protein [Pseudonocardia asaccharolytica]GEL19044.1 hypothetical protein PA7_28810 [Pseudonocardia asaccharolytica DSM 44247 = NBRC 16224]